MFNTLDYIEKKFSKEWITNFYQDNDYCSFSINHPKNDRKYLNLMILPEIMGIAVMLYQNDNVDLDLGGFDYSFSQNQYDEAIAFLDHFFDTGETKN